QNTPFLPINKIWAFSWGGMVLHVAFKLPRSGGHQHEQNSKDSAHHPASRIEAPLQRYPTIYCPSHAGT
ncbi:hypothetical protein, partial [Klebsiella pneumoniae]|uniref:hypothetical protein n=1 Tax=Klebsiella pneumoniae TaxID=573 RepID=UPI001C712DF0